jgi:hypothetical protein
LGIWVFGYLGISSFVIRHFACLHHLGWEANLAAPGTEGRAATVA